MTQGPVRAGKLSTAEVGQVLALAGAAAAADGVPPLSEHVLLHLRYDQESPGQGPAAARERGRDLVVTVGAQVAGYAYLDPEPAGTPDPADTELTGELVVRPDRRGEGLGLALVRELIGQAAGHRVRLWAHGDLPAAARLAETAGLERIRALWQMRRSLRDRLDEPRWPAGIALRTFVPGEDEDEWLSLNSRAFASHPEQGAWTKRDIAVREREPWFDPAGFFIAERNGAMAGFHWTKVHAQERLGEVYVLGVDPAEQGTGLGRALTLAGLRHLRQRGLPEAMLYVDEDNAPAIRLYTALGFARTRTDAMYWQPAG